MKNPFFILILLISLSVNWQCGTVKETDEHSVFHLDLDNNKTFIDLKLSDLIDSCRLVPLETTNVSLLGNYFYFINITDDFILIVDKNGVNKFTADGKFIRRVINIGRGPQEISGSCQYFYQEDKNLLFITDDFVQNDSILCYNIKTETFMPSIKKCFPTRWENFIIYEDSLILGSILGLDYVDPNPYAIFIQNFKGDLITGIKSKRSLIHPKNGIETFQRMFIYTGDQSIHLSYFRGDTLFNFINNNLSPYLIPYYNSRTKLPKMIPDVGYKQVGYENPYENKSFMIFNLQEFAGWNPRAQYKISYYFLNKSTGKFGEIKSYTDDLMGKVQNMENSMSWTPGVSEEITFPKSLANGKLYVSYYPNELLKHTHFQEKSDFSKNLYTQLSQIKAKIDETDNPILLIGVPKTKWQSLK